MALYKHTRETRYTKSMSEQSVFSKIVSGEIPSHKVYEDEITLAFLDIYAVVPGHTLVIPKRQVEFVWDLEPADYDALMTTVKKVALRLRDVLGSAYVGEKIIGTDVPHAHVHLIPFDEATELHRANQENAEPDHTALAELAKKLFFE
jgi:histidine triad (HIT) family protein